MEDKLTKQDKKFVEKVVETGNLTKAVQEAYDIEDPKYASVKGQRLIAKDRIKNAIQTLADRIPDDKLHQVLMDGLDATKRSGTGGMKIGIGTDGKVNDFGHTEIDEPDYATRHKYLDTALKIKGAYELDEQKTTINLMQVLVKFLDKKDDETNNSSNTD